jgi:hypothetical protein
VVLVQVQVLTCPVRAIWRIYSPVTGCFDRAGAPTEIPLAVRGEEGLNFVRCTNCVEHCRYHRSSAVSIGSYGLIIRFIAHIMNCISVSDGVVEGVMAIKSVT